MIIKSLPISGAYLIQREPNIDKRGYFARTYCQKEFNEHGININIRQINLCDNKYKYTLRGMHLQKGECAEDKVVSCNRGRIFDVFIDMRQESDTYLQHCGYELSEDNGYMLYIPKGCAHGYLTLDDDSQLLYLMSQFYVPGMAIGYRYDDPIFEIQWPCTDNLIISEKDLKWDYL